jgi:hypothetical protein
MLLRDELITQDIQHDLDKLGIAKNAREEQLRARAERLRLQREQERMAQLYRQHVLKEAVADEPKLVQLEPIKQKAQQKEISISGD